MRRKWIVLPVAVFGLIAVCVGAYAAWSVRGTHFLMPEAMADDETSPAEAYLSVQAYVRSCVRGREASNEWLATEVAHAGRTRDLPRLVALYKEDEAPFKDDEEAALLACRGLLLDNKWAELQRIRDLWRGREKHTAGWLEFDADVLLRQNRASEARTLLMAHTFPGAGDARRLARLALAAEDGWTARDLARRAMVLAPDDADVRDCRGRLCEAEGRLQEAEAEYMAALALRSDDLVVRDRLASCYRRAGAFDAALATWLPDGASGRTEVAWFKAWFWNRVGRPIAYDWEGTAPDSGPLRVLAEYLLAMPSDQFWLGDSAYGHMNRSALEREDTFWLRLLAMLKSGQEREADYAIRTSPFRHVSRDPDLEDALDLVLTYRAGQSPQASSETARIGRPFFFRQLELLASSGSLSQNSPDLPGDVKRLLGSDEALAAVLLAAGWDEAALQFHHANADLSQLPGWFVDRLVRAMWANHGAAAALAIVRKQPRNTGLDLVAGELLLASGRGAEALERLQSAAAAASGDCGSRAAWLYAVEALREKRPAEARRMLEAFPALSNDVEGQSLLARCAVAEGNEDLAERLYREIAGESVEAREYLSHRAVASGDWSAAGRLSGGLIRNVNR
jgi:tetratricopeptide (TPR) repeat protein